MLGIVKRTVKAEMVMMATTGVMRQGTRSAYKVTENLTFEIISNVNQPSLS